MQDRTKQWEIVRSYFELFDMPSMEMLLQSIADGVRIVSRLPLTLNEAVEQVYIKERIQP